MEVTPEYSAYLDLIHWTPLHDEILPEKILPKNHELFPLFAQIYHLTKDLYNKLPLRKNLEDSFIHPLNVAYFLSLVDVERLDEITLICGLLHDYLEEAMDIEDKTLSEVTSDFTHSLQKISQFQVTEIIDTVALLTRRPGQNYLKSYIPAMFQLPDAEMKQRVVRIKLADRLHNVLCIESFNKQERIYECFKNFSLLNNVKKYLLDLHGATLFNGKINNATEMLFNKCIKGTHGAFLHICHSSIINEYPKINSMLQVAFKKFTFLHAGLERVPEPKADEYHLIRLYLNVIRKYETLLHKETREFQEFNRKEMEYCAKFFKDFHFSEEQLQDIIDYKDAYFLKEATVRLLYDPSFVINGFLG